MKISNTLNNILEYLKITFKSVSENKKVFMPIIIFTLIRALLSVAFVISLSPIIKNLGDILSKLVTSQSFSAIQPTTDYILGTPLIILIFIIIVNTLGFTMLEAKLFLNFRDLIPYKYLDENKKGFFRTFAAYVVANLIIIFAWLVILIPYLVIGLLSLTIGLTLIPFFIEVMLMYYKGIYVVSDKGIFESIGESFSFAKKNLLMSVMLHIFTLTCNVMNLVAEGSGGSSYNRGINGILNYKSKSSGDINSQIDAINPKLDAIVERSPIDPVFITKVITVMENIIMPISFILIMATAIVFLIRQVITTYFAFTATYIYSETNYNNNLQVMGYEYDKI